MITPIKPEIIFFHTNFKKQIIFADNEFEASSGGINDEIIAATNVNSALFPKYYRRAVGFTGKLSAQFVNNKLFF